MSDLRDLFGSLVEFHCLKGNEGYHYIEEGFAMRRCARVMWGIEGSAVPTLLDAKTGGCGERIENIVVFFW